MAKFALMLLGIGGIIAAPLFGQTSIETAVLEEINFLRADPAGYARELQEEEQRFEANILPGENGQPDLMTNEGPAAFAEAAGELRRSKPLEQIRHSDLLAKAAADHVRTQGASGDVGHYSDGKSPGQRVKARGGNIYVGEVIVYGFAGPRNAVQLLVVDDGVPDRGHRKLLMAGHYRYAGVACGDHREWRNMCVVVLSETTDGSPNLPPKEGH